MPFRASTSERVVKVSPVSLSWAREGREMEINRRQENNFLMVKSYGG
jgi:hypothetical protein